MSSRGKGRYPGAAVPIAGAIVLWGILALAFPGLDPEEGRGQWSGKHGESGRLWCPACRALEQGIWNTPLLSNLGAFLQMIALAAVVAGVRRWLAGSDRGSS